MLTNQTFRDNIALGDCMNEIGKLIKALREERGVSQLMLAQYLNCSKQTISNYESGRRRPSYEILEAICDIFNVPRAFFFTEEEQRQELQKEYSRENYNGLNVEETLQFSRGMSKEAMNIALAYDRLDEHGQEAVRAIMRIESSRIEFNNITNGIATLDRIGAKRTGTINGMPLYEMGDHSVASAKYYSRAERSEMEAEESKTTQSHAAKET